MWEKPNNTTKSVFIIFAIAVIFATIILSYIYVSDISKLNFTESNVEVLATLASIFVSITVLIFVDIIRSESWKRFKYYKFISIFMVLILISIVFLLFGASSISIINSKFAIQHTILLMYYSIELCMDFLTILLLIYTYFS